MQNLKTFFKKCICRSQVFSTNYLFISLFFFTYFKSRNFVNTFTANDKYSLFNRNNLEQPIQILISEKQKNFPQFFIEFFKSTSNIEHFQKKDDSHS